MIHLLAAIAMFLVLPTQTVKAEMPTIWFDESFGLRMGIPDYAAKLKALIASPGIAQ